MHLPAKFHRAWPDRRAHGARNRPDHDGGVASLDLGAAAPIRASNRLQLVGAGSWRRSPKTPENQRISACRAFPGTVQAKGPATIRSQVTEFVATSVADQRAGLPDC